MYDHKVGHKCQVQDCRQIDWMPLSCKYCHGTFCSNHGSIENHSCKEIEKEFNKVIQCPFCLHMLKTTKGFTNEEILSLHEAMDCKGRQEVKVELCAKEKCTTKLTELNKFVCKQCDKAVCTKHRFGTAHTCVKEEKRQRIRIGAY